MKTLYFSLISVLALFGLPGFAQTSGSIAGMVQLSATNQPLSSVTVVAWRHGARPAQSFTARSAGNGTFTLSGLAAGRYVLCASDVGSGRLDPCIWASRAQQVDVAAGQQVAGQVITIPQARRLRVRVDDPAQDLKKDPRDLREPYVSLTVVDTNSGMRLSPAMKVKGSTTQEFELWVPEGRSYQLEAGSPDVLLRNSSGIALDRRGASQSFTVTASSNNDFSFTVIQRR